MDYCTLLERKDPTKSTIKKNRICFLWEQKYFELDEYISPHEGLLILEVELDSIEDAVILPSFLKIKKEITSDESYSNYNLANAK